MPQKKCDWMGCREIGFFDGLDKHRSQRKVKGTFLPFLN